MPATPPLQLHRPCFCSRVRRANRPDLECSPMPLLTKAASRISWPRQPWCRARSRHQPNQPQDRNTSMRSSSASAVSFIRLSQRTQDTCIEILTVDLPGILRSGLAKPLNFGKTWTAGWGSIKAVRGIRKAYWSSPFFHVTSRSRAASLLGRNVILDQSPLALILLCANGAIDGAPLQVSRAGPSPAFPRVQIAPLPNAATMRSP